jgi:hypothetical protein
MQSALERDGALAMLDLGRRPDATRFALAAVPVTSTMHRPFKPLNAGCTPGSSAIPRRWGDARVVALDAPPERRCIGLFW